MPPRVHRIEVANVELVTAGGVRRVSWRVQRADGWVRVGEWPGVVEQRLDPGPGTIWETRFELELPTGSWLERVESRPAAPERRDALDYLSDERRTARRKLRRSRYRVSARGELVLVENQSPGAGG